MKELIGVKFVELAIALLQGFFTLMSLAGKTPEEQDTFYADEKTKFQARKPEDLPEVPV